MTPEQTALLARLDGWYQFEDYWKKDLPGNKFYACYFSQFNYDDERNLMPLAFDKYELRLTKIRTEEWHVETTRPHHYHDACSKSWKEAIQQALLAIAREKFSGADTSV